MITLKNKIIRNFIAGILACVLVFSILITLFVTFKYSSILDQVEDERPDKIYTAFKDDLSDDKISEAEMWEHLRELAIRYEADVYFLNTDGDPIFEEYSRDPDAPGRLRKYNSKVVNVDKQRSLGTIHIAINEPPSIKAELQDNFTTALMYGLVISLSIGVFISFILSEMISEPIMNMSEATRLIKDGYYDVDDELTDIKEIENLQNNINYLATNLKNQENIRKQYAQDISHELRTPLTNLQLTIEAIRDEVIEPDQESMDALLEDVKRLEGLVVGLKKTFDESVEYFEVKNEDVNLTHLINNVVSSFNINARKSGINIKCHLEDDVHLKTDADKFTQILTNLISNSIKAIGSNGNIDIHLKDEDDKLIVKVIDDGIGMEEEKIDRIFERFYRIEDARNTKENGHGLGLSITKNFVDALGGKIKVESKVNEGTAFTLTFIK